MLKNKNKEEVDETGVARLSLQLEHELLEKIDKLNNPKVIGKTRNKKIVKLLELSLLLINTFSKDTSNVTV
jgi:hypothetical protein